MAWIRACGGGNKNEPIVYENLTLSAGSSVVEFSGYAKLSADSYTANNGSGGLRLFDVTTGEQVYAFVSGTIQSLVLALSKSHTYQLKPSASTANYTITFSNLVIS